MNCKPGDLAYFRKLGFHERVLNLGKVVEVLSFAGENPVFEGNYWCYGLGPCWLVACKEGLSRKDGLTLDFKCPVPDAWLRPFAGPSITHTIDVEMRVKGKV